MGYATGMPLADANGHRDVVDERAGRLQIDARSRVDEEGVARGVADAGVEAFVRVRRGQIGTAAPRRRYRNDVVGAAARRHERLAEKP